MKFVLGFITYNAFSAKYLPYFLDSLFKSLDNFSRADFLILAQDNSEEFDNLNRQYIEGVCNKDEKLVSLSWSGKNIGFSAAYNIMIKQAQEWGAEAFLMINPDVVVSPAALKLMLEALKNDEMLASVAPKILRWDFEREKLLQVIDSCGIVLRPGLKFFDLGQGMLDDGRFDNAPILGPSGACALFRMSALEKIKQDGKYLEPRMFMYKEDCDLVYRLHLAGFSSLFLASALIHHDRSVSSNQKSYFGHFRLRAERSKQVRSWSFVNQHLLFIKFWAEQNLTSKALIVWQVTKLFILALFLEPFLLKNYPYIRQLFKNNRQ